MNCIMVSENIYYLFFLEDIHKGNPSLEDANERRSKLFSNLSDIIKVGKSDKKYSFMKKTKTREKALNNLKEKYLQ